MRVLSLFDGIAGARQALKNLNVDCEYYASEVDRYAIEVAKSNHPDIIHVGDIKGIQLEDGWIFHNQNNDPMKNGGSFKADIDLLIGGSPCQDLSIAGKGKGLEGERSGLFFEYLRILNDIKPKYFVLENVASMKPFDRDIISQHLGVKPIMINSSLLTAQNRKRFYWVGKLSGDKYEQVNIEQPEDRKILLKDIMENVDYKNSNLEIRSKSKCVRVGGRNSPIGSKQEWDSPFKPIRIANFGKGSQGQRVYSTQGKSVCLNSLGGGWGAKTSLYEHKELIRRLSPLECERLQGFSDNYTTGISEIQRYKALGNSFTVPVIEHILKSIF